MNHKYIKLSFCITMFALAGIQQKAVAQAKNLTLKEAISLSLENSKVLTLSKAKIDEALAAQKEAEQRRLPDVSASGSYLRINHPTVKLAGSSDGSSSGSDTSSLNVSGISQVMYGMATVTEPIFAGFKVKAGIESAKYLAEATKLDAEEDKEAVIQNTIAAYSNLYKAGQSVQLVQENLKQSKQRVADFINLEKNGLMARNDLLKVQLQQSNVELTLVDAENALRIATVNMDLMLGLPENTELTTNASEFVKINESRGVTAWEDIAFQQRKDAAALGLRTKAAIAGVKAAKGDYYPSLAVTGGYVAAYIPNFITITNALNGGIGLSYSPSSLWKAGSKVQQAKARVAQLEANQAQLSDAIRMQTTQAYENYLSSIKKIEVYNTAVEQATENYRITKNKYDNSLVTTTDLLDADVAQLQAQLNYAYAKADAVVTYNKLLQTTGTITDGPYK